MTIAARIGRALRRLRRDERGLSALEVAFAVPVALSLTLNGIELTRYVILHQKTERASMTVADLVSQGKVLTTSDLNNIFLAGSYIVEPFDFDADGAMIVSSVVGTTNGPVVEWQRVYGVPPNASHLGNQGGPATLPAGFTVPKSESAIMTEIYFDYVPMFPGNPILGGSIGNGTVYDYAIFRPRYTVKVRLGT